MLMLFVQTYVRRYIRLHIYTEPSSYMCRCMYMLTHVLASTCLSVCMYVCCRAAPAPAPGHATSASASAPHRATPTPAPAPAPAPTPRRAASIVHGVLCFPSQRTVSVQSAYSQRTSQRCEFPQSALVLLNKRNGGLPPFSLYSSKPTLTVEIHIADWYADCTLTVR